MLALAKQVEIQAVTVRNMLRPDLRVFRRMVVPEYSTVGYVARTICLELEEEEGYSDFIVLHNGRILGEEDFESVYVKEGDNITVCVTHGLQMLAGVVWVALWKLGLYWGINVIAYVIAGAIMVGAGLLINTFLRPSTSDAQGKGDASSSYGFGGANPTDAGYPVPVVCGYVSTMCPIIGSYRTIDTDYSMWQWLLFAACVGPTNNPITPNNVYVGDELLTTRANYAFDTTDGGNYPYYSNLSWFDRVRHDRPFSRILPYGFNYHLDTLGVCHYVTLMVEFTGGLFAVDSGGNMSYTEVSFQVIHDEWSDASAQTTTVYHSASPVGNPVYLKWDVGSASWRLCCNMASEGIDQSVTFGSYLITIYHDADPSTGGYPVYFDEDSSYATYRLYAAVGILLQSHLPIEVPSNSSLFTLNGTHDANASSIGVQLYFNEAGNYFEFTSPTSSNATADLYHQPILWTVGGASTAAVRASYPISFSAFASHSITITRVTADDSPSDATTRTAATFIGLIEEIAVWQLHPGIQAVSVGVKATDSVNGQIPAIRLIQNVGTRSVRNWTDTGTMSVTAYNPAYVAYYGLTDQVTGLGISPTLINKTAWDEWAAWCSASVDGKSRAECNIVFDEQGSFSDNFLYHVEQVGRAKVVQYGSTWTVIVDKPKTSTYVFSRGNILKDSFSWESYEKPEKVDAVEIVYWDKDRDFRRTSVFAKASWYESLTTQPKIATVELRGCNNYDQALREATFRMQKTEYITRHGKLQTGPEAIFCERGDVVEIIHPTNVYGFSGKFARDHSAASSLYLDQYVTMAAADFDGKAKIFVVNPDGQREEFDVLGPWDKETNLIEIDGSYTGYRFDTFGVARPNEEKILYQIVDKKISPPDDEKREHIEFTFVEYVDAVFYHPSWGSGAVAI